MFEQFAKGFAPTARELLAGEAAEVPSVLSGLFDTYGGTTFDNGIYRIHNTVSSKAASEAAALAYPALRTPLVCFGFDWLGRQFALDLERGTPEDPEVVLLKPGTGEALEVPVAFSDFHDDALFRYRDSCLLPDWFGEWLAAGGTSPAFTECIGYKRPLFLGGQDDTSNLEVIDIDVYWSAPGRHTSPPGRHARLASGPDKLGLRPWKKSRTGTRAPATWPVLQQRPPASDDFLRVPYLPNRYCLLGRRWFAGHNVVTGAGGEGIRLRPRMPPPAAAGPQTTTPLLVLGGIRPGTS